MGGDQIGSLVYLGLMAVVIGGWFVVANRRNLGKMAQFAAIWTFIFLGAIVAVGLWDSVRDEVLPRQSVMMDGAVIAVPQDRNGHFYLSVLVNGTPVEFVVDTGATDIVLNDADARRAGLDPERLIYSDRALTANGTVATAPVRLDKVSLGGVTDEGMRAVVNAGDLSESLLGMAYLSRFSRIEIAGGVLTLER